MALAAGAVGGERRSHWPDHRNDRGVTAVGADMNDRDDSASVRDDRIGSAPRCESSEDNERRSSTFAALAEHQYRRLFITGFLGFFAVQAQQIARGQLAFDLTGTNTGLGVVYLGFGVPMLLITPFGGVFADRFPKRTVMLISQTCLVISAAWVAFAGALGVLEYWILVGASVLQGVGFSILGPTRTAYTAELVPRRLIGNAVALTQLSLNSTRVLAPAIAGVLIAVGSVGTTGVYAVTTVVMVIALGVTFGLPRNPARLREMPRSVFADLDDGVRYVSTNRLLRMLILSSFVLIMSAWPYLAFLPAVANEMHDAGTGGLGLLNSVSAVAALLVTTLIARRSRPNQAWRIQSTCGLALVVGLFVIAIPSPFIICLVAVFVIGGATSGYQAMNSTIVLMLADFDYHGRVQSLLALSFAGSGIAALPLGLLADRIGLRATFAVMGAICLAVMTAYMWAQGRERRAGGNFDLETSPV